MGRVTQGGEFLQSAQHGVGGLIVTGVIAVAGEAFADGVEIKDGRAQRGDIIHLFRNMPVKTPAFCPGSILNNYKQLLP